MRTEAQTLCQAFEMSRNLSMSFFKLLEGKDLQKEFECEGKKLNSAYWIMGHLAVTENYLLLKMCGGEIERFAWARPFGLGGAMPAEDERPSMEEMLKTLDTVHQKAMQHIAALTEEQLNTPIETQLPVGKERTIRGVILHAIRHEASHAGHLGWLCKLHGVKTL